MEIGKISKSDGLNNGVMLRFTPGRSVTVQDRPYNVLGVEQEVGVEKSKIGSPPYFYFRFGRQRPLDDGFRRISARAAALSPVMLRRSVQAPKSVRIILLPVR